MDEINKVILVVVIFFAIVGGLWLVIYLIAYAIHRARQRKVADHIRKYFEAAEKEERQQEEQNPVDWKKIGRPFPGSHDDE